VETTTQSAASAPATTSTPPAFISFPERATADLSLPGPGLADLMGVAETEAWISFEAPVDVAPLAGQTERRRSLVRYDAVLDLASGCVRETYRALLPSTAEPPAGTEEPLGDPFARPGVREALGHYLGFLDRFPVHYLLAVPRRDREFGNVAYTADKKQIAVADARGLHLSSDYGHTFTQLEPGAYSPSFIGGRFLVAWARLPASASGRRFALIYSLSEPSQPLRRVSVPSEYTAVGSTKTSLLFAHYGARRTESCLSELDVATGELATRHCMNTPPHRPSTVFLMLLSPNGAFGEYQTGDFNQTRIHIVDTRSGANLRTLSDHVFGVARSELADDGSYVWQSSSDSQIRIAGPRGDAVLRTKNEFLGLDLAGHALLFRRPPLKRQHKTGEIMPPTAGSLADYRCSLLEVADVYAGK
jgi:hypothetical protein